VDQNGTVAEFMPSTAGFLSSATSMMPDTAKTTCAAATERLNRVVAGTYTSRVHWKGLFSLSDSLT